MNQNDFYDAGFKVFGLLGMYDHDGSVLDEKQQYKKPHNSNWQYTPDWSEEQFETMHEMGQFETGYGVLVNGLLVVDVDARNGGVASFEKLCSDLSIDLLGISGLAVRTGSGGGSMHIYFKAPESVAMMQSHKDYPGIDFKASGYVVGPSSLHASGNVYETMHGHPDDVTFAPHKLVQLLKKPDHHRTEYNGQSLDITDDDLRAMLSYYNNDDVDYEEWIRVGMAIHDATCGGGFAIWDDWSKSSKKYDPSLMQRKWHSFGKSKNPVTIGTIIHMAKSNGWRSSYDDVIFNSSIPDDEFKPLDTSGVDLKRPPGFVGELAQWINSQCYYPRENLSVAAALNAIGSIGGLRHIDALNGFTGNLYSLCVAGSSTGKESVQQCYAKCLSAAGIADALHGSIKSEQEMVRNLIRHQASYYVVDEFGIFLRKLVNAGGKNGASYLEGVIGLAMSAYSKANDYLPISGDLKEFIKEELKKEAAACSKGIDNNEDKHGKLRERLDQVMLALDNIKRGIKAPYVTLMGFTTPVTFNELITYEMATNGFISRAMIFDEPETNPKPNKRFVGGGMPSHIEARLAALYNMGDYSVEVNRVEFYGDKQRIETTEDGLIAMRAVSEAFWEQAEQAKESGLEAIPRRGYELVAKISFILSIPEGIRTAEHIRWAYALVKNDVDRKMRLAYSNMQQQDDPASSIATKIQSILSDATEPSGRGVLINRCRPAKREAVEKVIDELVKGGFISEIEGARKSKKYQLAK